ncbi:MAG: hypothetical protein ACLUNV_05740 [Sutterella wadsworthensis]
MQRSASLKSSPAAVHLFSIERPTPRAVLSARRSSPSQSPLAASRRPAASATFATPWSMLLPTVMPTRVANFTPRAVVLMTLKSFTRASGFRVFRLCIFIRLPGLACEERALGIVPPAVLEHGLPAAFAQQ